MLKTKLLTPVAVPMESVEVPALGETVYVKGMTVRQRNAFDNSLLDSKGNRDKKKAAQWRERIVVACCCDADGNLLFTEDDITALSEQRADVLEPIVDAAQKLVGGKVDEDAAKNSQGTDADS